MASPIIAAPGPGHLFIALWAEVGALSSDVRAAAFSPSDIFCDAVGKALALNSAAAAYAALQKLMRTKAMPVAAHVGQCLEVMRQIDAMFGHIHPRSRTYPVPARYSLPAWLGQLKDQRILNGYYLQTDAGSLLPNGPLAKTARHPGADGAETMADHFTYLVAVPLHMFHGDSPIAIAYCVVGAGADGVPGMAAGALEKVAFVPTLEAVDDLEMQVHTGTPNSFVTFGVAATVQPAQRVMDALGQCGRVDIVMAPEFAMPDAEAMRLSALLQTSVHEARLVVAGSGPVSCADGDKPLSQVSVFNSNGVVLWQQAKIWPAEISPERAKQYGLNPGAGRLFEHVTGASSITVADLDHFGRCVILTCQDIKTTPLAAELIRRCQPDWVFVPVLDCGDIVGRWAHQEAFPLSGVSPARFIVANSLSLCLLLDPGKEPQCGLLLGPKSAGDKDKGRACKAVTVRPGSMPAFAVCKWDDASWALTSLGVEYQA